MTAKYCSPATVAATAIGSQAISQGGKSLPPWPLMQTERDETPGTAAWGKTSPVHNEAWPHTPALCQLEAPFQRHVCLACAKGGQLARSAGCASCWLHPAAQRKLAVDVSHLRRSLQLVSQCLQSGTQVPMHAQLNPRQHRVQRPPSCQHHGTETLHLPVTA